MTASKSGVPDILACDPKGKFWAFEVKVEGNKPSPLQEYNIKLINDTGGEAHVVYSLEDVKEAISAYWLIVYPAYE